MVPDCYEVLEHLGEGTYGSVCKVRDRSTDEILALKRMANVEEDGGVAAATIREVMMLRVLSHPNIVALRRVHMCVPNVSIALEHCEYDMKKYMASLPQQKIPSVDVRRFMHHLLCGLAYLHQTHHVVHRDLKLQNLLVSHDPLYGMVLKLADFGLVRIEGFPVKKYVHDAVTLWYRAPDIILGNVMYGFTADIWSAGVIFAQLMTGELLFKSRDEVSQMRAIFQFLGRPNVTNEFPSMALYRKHEALVVANKLDTPFPANDHLQSQEWFFGTTRFRDEPHAQDLLLKLLRCEPSDRLSAGEALQHPYFDNVDVYPGSLPFGGGSTGASLTSPDPELCLDGSADHSGGATRIISILSDGDGAGSESPIAVGFRQFSTSAALAEGLWIDAALQSRRAEMSSGSFEDSTRRIEDPATDE